MSQIPAWLTDARLPTLSAPSGRAHVAGAVRRGLASLGTALAAQLAPTRTTGWLSAFDARAKVIAAVVLIVAVSLVHGLPALGASALLAVAIALSAGLRRRELAPLWLGVPLFTLALALPATLNLLTPGPAVWVIWTPVARQWGPVALPDHVAVTLPGLVVAGRFLLRALASVLFALTLTATTEPAALVNGLRRLGMPRVFGMILTMMQRYLCVILRTAEELHLARLSRTIAPETTRQGQRLAAAGIGALLLSSLRLAEGVHSAMVARGYDGDIRTLAATRWTARDAILVAAGLCLAAALILCDRML
jgi:cobalt/nickel transport system permease protein